MTNFYPDGYQVKEATSDYMRLEEGDNKIRILTKPIIGYESWYEDSEGRKPLRFKTFNEAVNDPRSDLIKEFHAFIVWNYQLEHVQLLNITQKGIQKEIFNYANDEDWGDPTSYDLVIKRTGKGLETEYSVLAKPQKELEKHISEAFKQVKIVSNEYFQSGHPIVRNKDENSVSNGDRFVKDVEKSLSEKVADEIPF